MKVVNVKKEQADVFCGRNSSYKKEYGLDFSKLGNPFKTTDEGKDDAIDKYANLVWKRWDYYKPILKELIQLEQEKGSDLLLGCFCKPSDCHCDKIVSAVNYLKKQEVQKTIKIGIVGSREFNNSNTFKLHVERIINRYPKYKIVLVSGGADGADKLAEQYAKYKGYDMIVIPAMWDQHGKAAGMIRNREIWRISDVGIAFWDGKSPGTKNSIEECEKLNKEIRVVQVFNDIKKNKVSLVENYTVELVESNPNKIYVFGDNLENRGKGGQAIIRDCKNTFGIPTKRKPAMDNASFFSDTDEETEIVYNKLKELKTLVDEGKEIVLPSNGLGTGLSNMEKYSPEIFKKMNQYINRYILGWKILK